MKKDKNKKTETVVIDGKKYAIEHTKASAILLIASMVGFAIGFLIMKSFVLWLFS